MEVVAVVETDKVALDIRAVRYASQSATPLRALARAKPGSHACADLSCAQSQAGVIHSVLVKVGDEVKEQQPIYTLEP